MKNIEQFKMDHVGISLKEYLIKYSNVDKKFIEDFINIQWNIINMHHLL